MIKHSTSLSKEYAFKSYQKKSFRPRGKSFMKIAVIGAGFCGLAITWHLLHSPLSKAKIHLIDSKGIGKGTSGIAAGLLHPYAGAHAKLNWRGQEGFQATKELIKVASLALGRPVTAQEEGILRLALNDEQLFDFQRCAERFPQDVEWMDAANCRQIAPGCADAPGLWIKKGLTIYSSFYLQGLWKACAQQGAKFEKKQISSLKELENFDMTIVAAGAETLQLPELASLPLSLVKGQVLEFSWPRNRAPLSCALNSHVYLLMTESRTSCLVGATYERGYQNTLIDLDIAQKELVPKAIELFPPLKEASIMNCYTGVRAVTPQHRPFMQRLSPAQWILTGMGSKGLLYHALFAKELVQKIVDEEA
jgi:glycine/D-amino acid oxidase-like deaminating enzyme